MSGCLLLMGVGSREKIWDFLFDRRLQMFVRGLIPSLPMVVVIYNMYKFILY